jgi:hypothetical protein
VPWTALCGPSLPDCIRGIMIGQRRDVALVE